MTTEIEVKIKLDGRGFRQLYGHCVLFEEKELRNLYYDQDGRLSQQKIMFRIRLQRGVKPRMTLKRPISVEDGCWENDEIEEELDLFGEHKIDLVADSFPVDKNLPSPFLEPLHELEITRLERLGFLAVHRSVMELPCGVMVELDRGTLPNGKTFFEVEIENSDQEAREKAVEDIKKIVGETTYSKMSKFMRFLAAISNLT